MLPPTLIMVLVHLLVCLLLYVLPEYQELEAPLRTFLDFKGEHFEHVRTYWYALIIPKSKPLDPHMVDWKYPIHPYNPPLWWGKSWMVLELVISMWAPMCQAMTPWGTHRTCEMIAIENCCPPYLTPKTKLPLHSCMPLIHKTHIECASPSYPNPHIYVHFLLNK